MALIDNLESYWKLDEASGTALDAHGSNDLTDNGTTAVTGKINNGRQFTDDEATTYLTHTDNTSLSTGDIDFTLSLWVLRPGTYAGSLVKKATGTASTSEYEITSGSTGDITFRVATGSNWKTLTGQNIGLTWNHIVCWHDSINNEIGLTVNNATPSTLTTSGDAVNDSTASFYIGNPAHNHKIDEVGFWKRVLTSQERTDLYNGGSGFAYPFTVPSLPKSIKPILQAVMHASTY